MSEEEERPTETPDGCCSRPGALSETMARKRLSSASSSHVAVGVKTIPSHTSLHQTEQNLVELANRRSSGQLSQCSHDEENDENDLGVIESSRSLPSSRGMVARKRTVLQIAATFLPRWLLTLAVALSIYGVLAHYSGRSVISKDEKRGFNAIITGLSIMQSLVLVASLNGMVGDLRWWILSRRSRSRKKVAIILRAISMTQLANLAMKTKRPKIYFTVAVWLVVVLGSQIAVASIALCYNTGAAETYALIVKGDIHIADMSEIYTDKVVTSNSRALGAQQYTANSYGIVSTAYGVVEGLENIPAPGVIFYPGDEFLFQNDSRFTFLFREISVASAIKDGIWATAVTTTRTVEASAHCNSWAVISGGDGRQETITVRGDEGPFNVTLPLAGGTDQTTYLTNTTENCGQGCSQVSAFETGNKASWYYKCNVTVHPVANATMPEHYISPNVSRLASSAIALQGYGVSTLAKSSIIQFQSYPLESIFGSSANGSTDDMSALLSRFTIGVIAAVAETNDPLTIQNTNAPEQGVLLDVTHPGLIALILVGVVVLQLLLEVVTAVVANQVVVPPRGALATAHVLRAMTADQIRSSTTSSLRKNQISRVSSLTSERGSRWIYKATPVPGTDTFDMAMEQGPD